MSSPETIVSISEVVDIYIGGTPKTSIKEYWDGDILWASARDVANCDSRYLEKTEKTITQAGVENSAAKIMSKDTIVITSRGTVGKICMLPFPMSFNQTCYGLVAKKGVVPLYLFYKLKSMLNQIDSLSYGTVFDTITKKTFDDLRFILPSEKEQRAIASILSSLDDKITLNHQMNSTLESIGQALFKHWFVDFEFPNEEGKPYRSSGGEMAETELGEVPKGWRVVRNISELCNLINYGYTQSSTDEKIGPKFLRVMDINKGDWIDWTNVPYCEIEDKNLSKYLLEKGDIVIARMADPGKLEIFESDISAVFASYLIRIRLKNKGYSYYLYYLMKSKYYQEFILGAASGSVQKNLNAKGLTNGLPIILPTDEIIGRFNKIIGSLREKINENVRVC
jgi:type I restriction enzyme S subunit